MLHRSLVLRTILRASAVGLAVAVAALSAPAPAAAQAVTGLPRQSPHARVEQTIGITEVAIDYHRPAVRDRPVWGALVPYGEVWRAGANDNTTISFSDPVTIDGKPLAAGTYGLHMIPGESQWTVVFSNDSTSWGSFSYEEADDALRVTVQPEKAPFQELLEYRFEDVTNGSAIALLHWAELAVPFEIGTDTRANALASIRRQLRHLPRFSWQGWSSAAAYCVNNDFNHEEALGWIDRSIEMERNPQNLQIKARLLQQTGRTDEALALMDEALAGANEAQTNAIGYGFLQSGRVDKAIEVFEKNTRDYPESWNVWDSLGEALAVKGETAKAVENYTKALNMTTDDDQKTRIKGILAGLEGS
jgi:tetratricopeptide (TPR) repeat protein